MITKYDVGDTVYIPAEVMKIVANDKGISYVLKVTKNNGYNEYVDMTEDRIKGKEEKGNERKD